MSTLWTAVPLPCNATSIRIFTIDSDDQETGLHCNFRTVSLSSNPTFTAISYTWRTPLGPRERISEDALSTQSNGKIVCNGFEVQVLDNLHHAMRQLWASYPRGTIFWADALCIDQSNVEERSAQVSAMSQIFRSASNVVIWLGPGTPSVSHALEFVEVMAGLTAEEVQSFALGNASTDLISDNAKSKLTRKDYWEALEDFFSRSWFIRAWIVQETLLAQQLTVLCGGQTISWDKLCLTSRYLMRFAQNLASFHPAFFTNSVYFDVPARLSAGRENHFERATDGLLHSLIISRKHVCFDVRDTVFSLIGIARVKAAYQSGEYALPVPDYVATTASVFHQTALHILATSDNLLLLAYAEGDRFRKIESLPSWVPDWSVRKGLGLAYTGYTSFQADGGRSRYAELRFDRRVLAIEVAMVDEVSMIGESKESVLRTGQFPQWLAIIASLQPVSSRGQTSKEVFWRTLLTDIIPDHRGLHHPAPQEFEDLFDSWLLSCAHTAQCQDAGNSPAVSRDSTYALAAQYGLQWLCGLLTKAETSATIAIRAARFKTVYSNALHVRLFRTAKGYLGVGSASIKEGDRVCIASGSRVPLVLRQRQVIAEGMPADALRYELVGAAYLHDHMHGEALDSLREGFHIVEIE